MTLSAFKQKALKMIRDGQIKDALLFVHFGLKEECSSHVEISLLLSQYNSLKKNKLRGRLGDDKFIQEQRSIGTSAYGIIKELSEEDLRKDLKEDLSSPEEKILPKDAAPIEIVNVSLHKRGGDHLKGLIPKEEGGDKGGGTSGGNSLVEITRNKGVGRFSKKEQQSFLNDLDSKAIAVSKQCNFKKNWTGKDVAHLSMPVREAIRLEDKYNAGALEDLCSVYRIKHIQIIRRGIPLWIVQVLIAVLSIGLPYTAVHFSGVFGPETTPEERHGHFRLQEADHPDVVNIFLQSEEEEIRQRLAGASIRLIIGGDTTAAIVIDVSGKISFNLEEKQVGRQARIIAETADGYFLLENNSIVLENADKNLAVTDWNSKQQEEQPEPGLLPSTPAVSPPPPPPVVEEFNLKFYLIVDGERLSDVGDLDSYLYLNLENGERQFSRNESDGAYEFILSKSIQFDGSGIRLQDGSGHTLVGSLPELTTDGGTFFLRLKKNRDVVRRPTSVSIAARIEIEGEGSLADLLAGGGPGLAFSDTLIPFEQSGSGGWKVEIPLNGKRENEKVEVVVENSDYELLSPTVFDPSSTNSLHIRLRKVPSEFTVFTKLIATQPLSGTLIASIPGTPFSKRYNIDGKKNWTIENIDSKYRGKQLTLRLEAPCHIQLKRPQKKYAIDAEVSLGIEFLVFSPLTYWAPKSQVALDANISKYPCLEDLDLTYVNGASPSNQIQYSSIEKAITNGRLPNIGSISLIKEWVYNVDIFTNFLRTKMNLTPSSTSDQTTIYEKAKD
ncbi:MAG: hypothetical protein AAFV95_27165 [Bacteroidota bacterium]